MGLVKPAIAVCVVAIIGAGLTLTLLGHRNSSTLSATFDPPYPELSPMGDPIRAIMEGRVPCEVAGCDKLKVTLVLYEKAQDRSPSSFWLGIVGTRGNDRVVTQGTWEMRRGVESYPEAIVYALDSDAGVGLRYFWRVNDNILLVVDGHMRPRSGNGAWGYMLSRYDAPYGPRTYTWTR